MKKAITTLLLAVFALSGTGFVFAEGGCCVKKGAKCACACCVKGGGKCTCGDTCKCQDNGACTCNK